jgi:hypothetical protein
MVNLGVKLKKIVNFSEKFENSRKKSLVKIKELEGCVTSRKYSRKLLEKIS